MGGTTVGQLEHRVTRLAQVRRRRRMAQQRTSPTFEWDGDQEMVSETVERERDGDGDKGNRKLRDI